MHIISNPPNSPFKVTLTREEGFSDKQWEKISRAGQLWEKAWNDPSFQDNVLHYITEYTYSTGWLWWKKYHRVHHSGFIGTDHTPAMVLESLLSGAEKLSPIVDHEADVILACGNKSGVLGWTYPNIAKQWISRWFLDSSSVAEIAGNLAHEYCHKLGYVHPYKNTPSRPHTVPYAIGYLTRNFAKRFDS